MDYPYYANYPTDNPSETDNSSSSVGLKRSMMVVMTVTIRTMNADDNHDIDHDVISYPDLTLFYGEKGPLAEGGLGTRLDMIIKMIMMMMIMVTMMMMTTTIILKRKKKELDKIKINGFVVICKLILQSKGHYYRYVLDYGQLPRYEEHILHHARSGGQKSAGLHSERCQNREALLSRIQSGFLCESRNVNTH